MLFHCFYYIPLCLSRCHFWNYDRMCTFLMSNRPTLLAYKPTYFLLCLLMVCSVLPEGDVWAEHCWRRAGDPGVCQQQQHAIWIVLPDFIAEDCTGAVCIKERKHHATRFRGVQRPIQKWTVDRSICCCGFWRGRCRPTCKQEGHHNNSWVCSGRSDAHRNGYNDR